MKVGFTIEHDQEDGRTYDDCRSAYVDVGIVGIHHQMPLVVVATIETITNAESIRDDDHLRTRANGMLS